MRDCWLAHCSCDMAISNVVAICAVNWLAVFQHVDLEVGELTIGLVVLRVVDDRDLHAELSLKKVSLQGSVGELDTELECVHCERPSSDRSIERLFFKDERCVIVPIPLPSYEELYLDGLDWDSAVPVVGENLDRYVQLVDEESILHDLDM